MLTYTCLFKLAKVLSFSFFVLKQRKKQRKFKAKPEPSGRLCQAIASPNVTPRFFNWLVE